MFDYFDVEMVFMERIILHADCNNYYASVECLYHPEWRNRPIAVSGNPEARHGIVLAKNYPAKACGVTTGEPLWMAQQKCPDILFVPPHFDKYMEISQIVRAIFGEYTDQVEPFGLDESWMDVTGSVGLFGDGKAIADELRRRIKFELGITISVGVSYNKIFAKLGSDLRKPDATTIISNDHFREIVWPLPVSDLLYVGRATNAKLHRYGVNTIGELAQSSLPFLEKLLGKNGRTLWLFANGLDKSPVAKVGERPPVKSIGNSTTTPRDLVTDEDVKITLMALCESVSARLREYGLVCRTVQIGIRNNQLHTYERQGKLSFPNRTASNIFDKAFELYSANRPANPIRSLSVRTCQLEPQGMEQFSFFEDVSKIQRQETLESTIDTLRNRFGHFSIRKGMMYDDKALSNLDPKNDHVIHPESYFH